MIIRLLAALLCVEALDKVRDGGVLAPQYFNLAAKRYLFLTIKQKLFSVPLPRQLPAVKKSQSSFVNYQQAQTMARSNS